MSTKAQKLAGAIIYVQNRLSRGIRGFVAAEANNSRAAAAAAVGSRQSAAMSAAMLWDVHLEGANFEEKRLAEIGQHRAAFIARRCPVSPVASPSAAAAAAAAGDNGAAVRAKGVYAHLSEEERIKKEHDMDAWRMEQFKRRDEERRLKEETERKKRVEERAAATLKQQREQISRAKTGKAKKVSGYVVFATEKRAQIQKANPSMPSAQLTKMCKVSWETCHKTIRKQYEDKAKVVSLCTLSRRRRAPSPPPPRAPEPRCATARSKTRRSGTASTRTRRRRRPSRPSWTRRRRSASRRPPPQAKRRKSRSSGLCASSARSGGWCQRKWRSCWTRRRRPRGPARRTRGMRRRRQAQARATCRSKPRKTWRRRTTKRTWPGRR